MRHAILLLLWAWANALPAQVPVEVVDQRVQIVRYDRVVADAFGRWIFAGVQQGWGEMGTLIVVRGDDGRVVHESATGTPMEPTVLAALPDGFVVGGAPLECSLPIGQCSVQRRAADGTVRWTTLVGPTAPASISVSATGLIAVGDPPDAPAPRVRTLDGNGDIVADWVLPWPTARVVRWEVAGPLLTLNDTVLARWSDSGTLLGWSSIPPGALDLAVVGSGDLRVLYGDRVVHYDGGLMAVDSVMLANVSQARWMEYADGLLWITCAEHFTAVDPSVGQTAAFSAQPIEGHVVMGTAVRDGLVMTAGTASVDGRSAGLMRSFTVSGEHAPYDEDVAISIASVDSLHFETFASIPDYVIVHMGVSIQVENRGSRPVQKVLLNTQRTVAPCGADFGGGAHPDTLLIPPGGSAVVRMPLVSSWPHTVAVGDTLRYERCYVALSPNDVADRAPADNRTCRELLFHNTTSMEEHEAFGGVTAAPVPFHDRLTITFGAPMTRPVEVTLSDASGRLLFRQGFGAGGQRFTVEAQDLPAGVSLLQADDGVQRVVKRVVRLP